MGFGLFRWSSLPLELCRGMLGSSFQDCDATVLGGSCMLRRWGEQMTSWFGGSGVNPPHGNWYEDDQIHDKKDLLRSVRTHDLWIQLIFHLAHAI
jgi:hypothetical protein